MRADADFEPITQKAATLTLFRSGRYLLGGQYDNVNCDLGDADGTPVNALAFSDAAAMASSMGSTRGTRSPANSRSAISAWRPMASAASTNPSSARPTTRPSLEIAAKAWCSVMPKAPSPSASCAWTAIALTIAGSWVQPTGVDERAAARLFAVPVERRRQDRSLPDGRRHRYRRRTTPRPVSKKAATASTPTTISPSS